MGVIWQGLCKEPGPGTSSTPPQQIMQFAKWEVGPKCAPLTAPLPFQDHST